MQSLMRGTNAKYEADMKIMADLCNERMTPAELSGCQGPNATLHSDPGAEGEPDREGRPFECHAQWS